MLLSLYFHASVLFLPDLLPNYRTGGTLNTVWHCQILQKFDAYSDIMEAFPFFKRNKKARRDLPFCADRD